MCERCQTSASMVTCKQLKHITSHGIWNECFSKIFIVFKFTYQLAIWFFIIQRKQIHAYNSHVFLSYLQTIWQFLKSNVRSSKSPAQKFMWWGVWGESWREGRVYGFQKNSHERHTWSVHFIRNLCFDVDQIKCLWKENVHTLASVFFMFVWCHPWKPVVLTCWRLMQYACMLLEKTLIS